MRPNARSTRQKRRSQQMSVDIPDSTPGELEPVNDTKHFCVTRLRCRFETMQVFQDHIAVLKLPKRQLANHKRMRQDLICQNQLRKLQIFRPKMVDPNRRIY